jgi:quercetin dioxygenase-like cupin family protein
MLKVALAVAGAALLGAAAGRGSVAHLTSTAELAPPSIPARVRMLLETHEAYMGHITLRPLSQTEEHAHDKSAEYIYVLMGDGELTMGGETYTVKAGDAIYIPPKVKHSVKVGSQALQAIQFYTPPGPEQRFKEQPPEMKKAAEEKARREQKAPQPE